ncbi:hypothetical protein [Tardiphaga sp. 709]|uniref:hypothetical protein n=1 Tax=Tardiphaga sp. 709 TaxID=3076039 RepID=UPI0028F170D0|nr:hypothetical protein [Tardiphaga sp. 709]WNV07952.1 hypothetical protein RSO67_20875 [Tardiphaga sp. 709]
MNWKAVIVSVFGVALVAAGAAAYDKLGPEQLPFHQSVPPPLPPFAAFGPDCEIAPVNGEHQFLAVRVYQGDTLANVQLGDPNGRATIVRVFVDRGAKPITVLLQANDSVIWDFEGDVARIARAIVIPASRDRTAVRGLPAANVDLLKLTRCPGLDMPTGDVGDPKVAVALQRYFGRAPERFAYQYGANAVALPAVSFTNAPKEGASRRTETKAEEDLLTYYAGGFRLLDPASLVTRAEVLVPETYPDMAGLVQLEREGAIRVAKRAEVDAFADGFSKPYRSKISPNFRLSVNFAYVITRDLMLPAGLHGAHLKNFLVLANVPPPRGAIGHGCLAFMDGFRMADDGSSCFGSSAASALRELAKLPAADAIQACRTMEVPAEAAMEAVSIYEPKGARHSAGSKRNPEPVDLRVSKPGAVVLVLNAYEPAIWRISVAEGTRISGVILTGYYTSRVEGLAPDVPMTVIDYEGRKKRLAPDTACAPFWTYLGTAYNGGPEAMVLDRQVMALTGKQLDGLRGAYALNSAEIR